MMVYLIRHTDAVDQQPDHSRPLSEKGQEQARTIAKFLRNSGAFTPQEIWHSSLVRARETAALIAEHGKFDGRVREVRGLRPEDDPAGIAGELAKLDRAVALVGHEPHLSTLAALLLTGSGDHPVVMMKKGAVLALEGAATHWVVRWHIYPGIIA